MSCVQEDIIVDYGCAARPNVLPARGAYSTYTKLQHQLSLQAPVLLIQGNCSVVACARVAMSTTTAHVTTSDRVKIVSTGNADHARARCRVYALEEEDRAILQDHLLVSGPFKELITPGTLARTVTTRERRNVSSPTRHEAPVHWSW